MKNGRKVIIILLLVIAVGALIIFKNYDSSEKAGEQNSNSQALADSILADIAGNYVTKSDLDKQYQKLPKQYQEMYADTKDEYLEQVIVRELIYLEAEKRGLTDSAKTKDQQFETAVQALFIEVVGQPEVTKAEIEDIYKQNKDQMPGTPLEQVESEIRKYLVQQKQSQTFDAFIKELRENADVKLNTKWVEEQIALRPKSPLDDLLVNGLPTVLDLGSDSCIPCKMMKPIFAELEEELAGKVNILILDVSEYQLLADKYKVRVIPTQIFFDERGQQYWRHEGFLSKEDILKKLEETGAKL